MIIIAIIIAKLVPAATSGLGRTVARDAVSRPGPGPARPGPARLGSARLGRLHQTTFHWIHLQATGGCRARNRLACRKRLPVSRRERIRIALSSARARDFLQAPRPQPPSASGPLATASAQPCQAALPDDRARHGPVLPDRR